MTEASMVIHGKRVYYQAEDDGREPVDSAEQIPQFATEAEEQAWWETHTLSETFWRTAERVPEDELPPTRPPDIGPRWWHPPELPPELVAVPDPPRWTRYARYGVGMNPNDYPRPPAWLTRKRARRRWTWLLIVVAALAVLMFALGFLLATALVHRALVPLPAPVLAAQEYGDPAWGPEQIRQHIEQAAANAHCGCAGQLEAIAERESNYLEIGAAALTITNPSSSAYGPMQFIPAGGIWDECPQGRVETLYASSPDDQFACAAWAFANGYASAWR